MQRSILTLLITSSISITASAQVINGTDSVLNHQHDLQPVEIRAVRAGTNTPFTKTDISGNALQKDNLGQDLPILLQYTPSVTTTSDAGAGVGYTGLHIRGVDPSRINITMNGIPMNDPDEQQTFFVDIPDIASSTSSIQIQRGVGTSTNGAGAFGATVSIGNLQQFDSAGAVFSSSFGSFNTWKNTLMAGTGMLKGGWQFDVRLSKISSDGYIQRASSDLKSLQFTAGWKASEKTWFHFMVMTGTEKTGQAWDGVPADSLQTNRTYNELGLKPDGTYYKNQTDNYQQDYYQLFADHTFNQYLTAHVGLFLTRGKGYYEEYHMGELLSDYGIENAAQDTTDLIRQLWLDNYYYGGVFSLLYKHRKTELTFGGGWTQFENKHYGIINWTQNGGVPDDYEWYRHDDQKNDLNLYLKAQQQIGSKLYLFGDVQYRNIAYNINGFQDDPQLHPIVNYNFVNPKAGISYVLRNSNSIYEKLYLSGAIGNREPNYDDYEVAPPNLPKPETLYDLEAGYELNKQHYSLGGNLYYMYYHNQLVLTGQVNDVGAYTQTNVPNSYRAGIELQAAYKPNKWLQLQGNATFSKNVIQHYTEYLYDDAGTQYAYNFNNTDIDFSPAVIAAGTIAITPLPHMPHGQKLEIDLTDKYVSRQYLDNTTDKSRSIDPYSFCNILIRYTVQVKPFKEVTASLALNNIFNQLYCNNGATYPYIDGGAPVNDNYYFPQAGFNVLGGVTLRF